MSVAVNQVFDPQSFYQTASNILEARTLDQTYETICNEAMRLVNAKYASIFIPEHDQLKRAYATSPIMYLVVPRKNGDVYQVFSRRRALLLKGMRIAENHPAFNRFNAGNVICVPLIYHQHTLGVLSVLSHPHKLFTKTELDHIRYFSPLASLAIQNAVNYARLEQAVEDRNFFISAAAHELKSPLTAAIGFAQLMLLQANKGKSIPKAHIERLNKSHEQLRLLIHEFLEIDRIKKGLLSYSLKRWSLSRIIQTSVDNFKHHHPDRPIALTSNVTGNSWVRADRSKLMEVFANVLNNAHKYSPQNTPISITLNQFPAFYRVAVTDQGIGIPQKNLNKLFNKFYSGNHPAQTGMGLGLFLTKMIVDKHEGKIMVQSKVHEGTTFTIELPIADNHQK